MKFKLIGFIIITGFILAGCAEDVGHDLVQSTTAPEFVLLSGAILEDRILTAGNVYLLRGVVFVGNDENPAALTIEPGTFIYGETASYSMLVVSRGSKIFAEGTATAPIVFTSDKPIGLRRRGDWGGVAINGYAPLNVPGGEAEGEGSTGFYGGNDPNDNSGVLRYVRIEFAGREITPENELNGLSLQGVGNGTVIEYIQVHMNDDDGIEFFGGTVDAKYIFISGCSDDQFDWTDGWQGRGQFWVCQQYGDDADQGIEADNSDDDNDALPRSHPVLYNLTLVGDKAGEASDIGLLLREGTAARIQNAIVLNFGDCALDLDNEATFVNAWLADQHTLSGELIVDHSIFFDNAETWQTGEDDEADFPFTTAEFITQHNVHNRFDDPGLVDPYNKDAPDFRPTAGSIALDGYARPRNDGYFENVNFIGGMAPDRNWLAGWTISDRN